MTLGAFRERYDDAGILEEFSLDESAAFADLAILVVLADREVNDEELEELGEQLLATAFENETQVDEVYRNRGVNVRREAGAALEDEDALDEFVRDRTSTIEGGAHREAALEMLATLAYADGLEPDEEDVCFRIGRAFGFPPEMVDVTFDDIASE